MNSQEMVAGLEVLEALVVKMEAQLDTVEKQSFFVSCRNQAEAIGILGQCFDEGFKAVASNSLNQTGWIVEYWK